MRRILVTGGAGYVGHLLTPQLLNAGYEVVVYDIMYFGHRLSPHPKMSVVEGDIRDTAKLADCFKGVDAVLHLACISNDPSFDLDEGLSKTINFDCFEPMVAVAKKAGVKRFIYCSSSSVYGVSDAPDVTEDHPLLPITLYNKFKGDCEPLLFKYCDEDFVGSVIRPATVCGYSPRLRLDLSVNILTNHAVTNRKITVFGGDQLRPNLHVADMCDLYELMLKVPGEKIQKQCFNAGYQNQSIMSIAQTVRKTVQDEMPEFGEIDIVVTPTNDPRSYHINSDKIRDVLGFVAQRSIEDAVRDLVRAFQAGLIPNSMDDDDYYNVRKMKALNAI